MICKDCKYKGTKKDIKRDDVIRSIEEQINPNSPEEREALEVRAEREYQNLLNSFDFQLQYYPGVVFCLNQKVIKVWGNSPAQQFKCDLHEI